MKKKKEEEEEEEEEIIEEKKEEEEEEWKVDNRRNFGDEIHRYHEEKKL